MIVIAEISPVDQTTGTRKLLRCTLHDSYEGTGVNGLDWSPCIAEAPVIGIRLFKGDFDSTAAASGGSLKIALDQIEKDEINARTYFWPGAPIKIWAGVAGQAWPWQQVFEGGIESSTAEGNLLSVSAKVNDEPFQTDVLVSKYAGTGGIEGGEDLKEQPKPLLVGRCFNVAPILINAVDNVYQVHGYGPIQAVTKLYERGSDFDGSIVAFAGDYASYAALVAGTIAPGRWGTCLAQGLIRLGAPQAGIITADVDGDKGGGIWRNQAGAVILRLCEIAGISTGLIETASFTAIDTSLLALPFDGMMGWYQTDQISVLSLASQFANDVNHVAGISLLGKMFASPLAIGSATITLDAQGREDPTVYSSKEGSVSPPFSLIELGYARSWKVHSEDEIATSGPDENILTISEKIAILKPKEQRREIEYLDWTTRAATLGTTALNTGVTNVNTKRTAWMALRNAIVPAWDNIAVNSPITRTSYDVADREYDDVLSALKTLISEEDARRATVDAVTGNLTGDGTNVANNLVANALVSIGSFSVVRGNTVSKVGGTHGAFEGGTVGTAFVNSAFVSSSLLNVAAGDGWETHLALDDDATSFAVASLKARARYTGTAAGSGSVILLVDNVQVVGPIAVSGLSGASRMSLAYDGVRFFVIVDGVICCQVAATANLRLWPKIIDFYTGNTITDVQYGAWSDNAWAAVGGVGRPADNATYGATTDANGVLLGSGGVQVDNSYVAPGQNLIPNSDQTSQQMFRLRWNPDGMVTPWNPPALAANNFNGWSTANYELAGNVKAAAVYQSGRVASPTYGVIEYDIDRGDGVRWRTPCVPGQVMIASAYFLTNSCVSRIYIAFEDAAGGLIDYALIDSSPGSGALGNTLANFERLFVKRTAPAGTYSVSIIVAKGNTSVGFSESYWWCAAPMLERASVNQQGPSPYMPGPPASVRQIGYTGDLNATLGATLGGNVKDAGGAVIPAPQILNNSLVLNADGTASYFNGTSYVNIGAVTINGLGYTGELNADRTISSMVVPGAPADVTVNATYTGVIITSPSQFNKVLTPTLMRNGVSVRTDNRATYTVSEISAGLTGFVTVNNTSGSADKGRITITNATQTSTFKINILWDGVLLGSYLVRLTVVAADPPLGGGGSGGAKSGSASVAGWGTAQTVFTEVGRVSGLVKATGEQIKGSLPAADYGLSASVTSSNHLLTKFQYSVAGANTWTDFGTAVSGSTAYWNQDEFSGIDGSVTLNQAVTPADNTYDIRLVAAVNISATGTITFNAGQSFSVIVEP